MVSYNITEGCNTCIQLNFKEVPLEKVLKAKVISISIIKFCFIINIETGFNQVGKAAA